MSRYKFGFGDRVKHRVSGFTGIIMTQIEWFNGCRRYNVQAEKLEKGVPVDIQHFDEQELALVKAGAVSREEPTKKGASPPGGPKDDAKTSVSREERR